MCGRLTPLVGTTSRVVLLSEDLTADVLTVCSCLTPLVATTSRVVLLSEDLTVMY